MGLLTSVNNINYELQKEKEIQLQEKIRKRKENEKKENLKRYYKELESFLYNEFITYFEIGTSEYIINFYDKKRKIEILNNFFDNIIIIDKNGFEKIPYKTELQEHFYNKYDTILKKAYKEQQQQEQFDILQQEQEAEPPKKEIDKNYLIKTIIKWLCIVLFLPIAFIILLFYSIIKNTK